VRSACAAAAAAVARGGTAVCRPEDLLVAAAPEVPGVLGRAELAALGRRARAEGRRVVFTNGCFDVLHPGHVTLLERARALGDLLVLGLNGDAAVTRLKGPGRPVLGLTERARLLGALACVDHVAAFEEDTAEGLVAALRPDVYAKGAATPRDEPPEAVAARALGAEVRYLPLPEDGPTGELLGRIRGVAGRGATTA
jgi:rfaE bifunctional protein nucleotidyltransferase chain/domain